MTMPLRVVCLLMREEDRRRSRIAKRANKSKAWPMVSLGDLEP